MGHGHDVRRGAAGARLHVSARTEREKMLAGEPYRPGDPELRALRVRAQSLARLHAQTTIDDRAAREALHRQMFGSVGHGLGIGAPVYLDYGVHTHIGDEVYLNFGVVLLDVCEIRIGHRTQIGPHAQLLAADHPREAAVRAEGLETGKPVTVGADCWIGAGALILPGVTIGDGAIVGAGAVVTRDVAPGATVAGNPARPLRGH